MDDEAPITRRDNWYWVALRNKDVGHACRLLLTHTARAYMDEQGVFQVKRQQLADDLQVHPQRITEALAEAVEEGLLKHTGGGVNGQVRQYKAQFPGNGRAVTRKGSGNGRAVTSDQLPGPLDPGNGRAVAIRARASTDVPLAAATSVAPAPRAALAPALDEQSTAGASCLSSDSAPRASADGIPDLRHMPVLAALATDEDPAP